MFFFLIQQLSLTYPIPLFNLIQRPSSFLAVSSAASSTTMSVSRQPAPTPNPGGVNCTNCGRFVTFKPCQSDKNGNKGVPFATCHGMNKDGIWCSFIRRASRSPSASPTLPSTVAFSGQQLATTAPSSSNAPMTGKCGVSGCGQSRFADDCPRRVVLDDGSRRICRKHCIDQGGCSSKTHKSMAPSPSLIPLLPSTPAPPTAHPPSHSPSLEAVDARADPRFVSHLRPIFTNAIAEQQEKICQQTIFDAKNKERAQKVKQCITVYPWVMENTPPTIKLHQDFTWPYVAITSDLLTKVGLLEASARGDLRMYDEIEVLDWVAIDVGYVMEVREGQRLFLKDASLRECSDFRKYLEAHLQAPASHLHRHLAREHAYVREMHKVQSPSSSPRQAFALTPQPSIICNVRSRRSPSLSPRVLSPPPTTPSPTSSRAPSVLPAPSQHSQTGHLDRIERVSPTESNEGDKRRWPGDYYTVDVGECMRKCESHATTHRTVFEQFFPNVRFVPSTFSNQRDLWRSASNELRIRYMSFGQTKQGLWSAFAKHARREHH